jgi:hypothetical protein
MDVPNVFLLPERCGRQSVSTFTCSPLSRRSCNCSYNPKLIPEIVRLSPFSNMKAAYRKLSANSFSTSSGLAGLGTEFTGIVLLAGISDSIAILNHITPSRKCPLSGGRPKRSMQHKH